MASRTYRVVLAGSTTLSGQYILMNIREHRTSIRNCRVGVCDHRMGIRDHRVGVRDDRVGVSDNRVSVSNDRVGVCDHHIGVECQFGLVGTAQSANTRLKQSNVR